MKRLFVAGSLAVGLVSSASVFAITQGSAAADSWNGHGQNSDDRISISADCYQNDGTQLWTITNPKNHPVKINWASDDGDESGSYMAHPGDSELTSPYDSAEPTENYVFSQHHEADIILSVAIDACEAPAEAPACIDGSIRDNIVLDWSQSTGIVSVHTLNNQPLCDDVTLYLSSYTLPSDYDKTGIFDDSSIPQQLLDSTSVTLAKGTDGTATLEVNLPDACTSYQLDLYYAPEITVVTGAGHGSQLLYGEITSAVQDPGTCDCPITPPAGGLGGGPATPETPETPVVTETAAPVQAQPAAQLTDTGSQSWLVSTLAAILLAAAVASQLVVRKQKA
ncbi:MAG TPA: hypothetical protein VLF59_01100 [Candidatus Saccharimonadales bacterium]|nr:hypothetical protein [Candidatus Saccharimonadales bacterium]